MGRRILTDLRNLDGVHSPASNLPVSEPMFMKLNYELLDLGVPKPGFHPFGHFCVRCEDWLGIHFSLTPSANLPISTSSDISSRTAGSLGRYEFGYIGIQL